MHQSVCESGIVPRLLFSRNDHVMRVVLASSIISTIVHAILIDRIMSERKLS